MKKIIAVLAAVSLMMAGTAAFADASDTSAQTQNQTEATETAAPDEQTDDQAAPEALDMMSIAEQNVFEFSFLKWYATPDEAMAAFGLSADTCVTAQPDADTETIDFDYPSVLGEGNAHVQLSFERIGDGLALTGISQTSALNDANALRDYMNAITTRAKEMLNAESIRKSAYYTFTGVSDAADKLEQNPGTTIMKSSTFSAYFTGADEVSRQINFSMQAGPAATCELVPDLQGEYYATYSYTLKENKMMSIFG